MNNVFLPRRRAFQHVAVRTECRIPILLPMIGPIWNSHESDLIALTGNTGEIINFRIAFIFQKYCLAD